MIHVVQHIPNFVEGFEPKRADVETEEEMLALPWVARWAESTPAHTETDRVTSWPNGVETVTYEKRDVPEAIFHRWSVSRHGLQNPLLMCERADGRWWWVVAILSGDVDTLTLPEWTAPEDANRTRD